MQKKEDIYYQLHNRIMTGEWVSGSRLPPEPELAKDLHIARKTLRAVFSRLEKDGLINRYPRLGTYVRIPEKKPAKRILLIMGDTQEHPFFNSIWVTLPEVIEYCHSLGMECDRLDIHMVDKNLPIADHYCGIILADATYYGQDDKIVLLRKTGLPMVIFAGYECYAKELQIAAVITDRRQAFLDGLEYLLQHGHRRICFLLSIDWEKFYMRTGISQKEMEQYIQSHGVNADECSFLFLQDWRQRTLSDSDSEQIRQVLSGSKRPTVFYCYTDYIAFQIKPILDSMKLRIPEDVALMGFSGFLHNSLVNRDLSTVDFRYDRIAKLAVDLLLAHKHWEGVHPPPIYHVPYEIMVRKSTDKCLIFEWEQDSAIQINSKINALFPMMHDNDHHGTNGTNGTNGTI